MESKTEKDRSKTKEEREQGHIITMQFQTRRHEPRDHIEQSVSKVPTESAFYFIRGKTIVMSVRAESNKKTTV